MAPLTNLEKAERDRDSLSTTIDWLDSELTSNLAVPLTEVQVDHFLSEVLNVKTDLVDAHRRILQSAIADTDLPPHQAVYLALIKRLSTLEIGFKEIKKVLTPPPIVTSTSGPGKQQDIRLPRLELPSFDGNLNDWMSFRDMFATAVHTNDRLSKAQKLTYLKSLLTGEAARQIKSMSLSDTNYDIAWTQLTDRYQNDRELLFAILRRFTEQPIAQSTSASQLRTLIDTSKECMRSLEVLSLTIGRSVGSILLFHIFQKLDPMSKELWEQTLKTTDIPLLQDLLDFLEQRARALAAGGSTDSQPTQPRRGDGGNRPRVAHVHHSPANSGCKVCSGDSHFAFQCSKFHSMPVPERFDIVKKLSLCFNCLREGHSTAKCTSKGVCRICKGKHHSLIHKTKPAEVKNNPEGASPLILTHHCNQETRISQTILATAVIRVQDSKGQQQLCRALLDGGSTSSFITESCARRLGLSRSHSSAEVLGLAASPVGTAKGALSMVIRPHFHASEWYDVNALILQTITSKLPVYPCDPSVWNHIQGLQLADPYFHKPSHIDILLGSDVFWNLLMDGRRKGPTTSPVALRSTLGWLIAGNVSSTSNQVIVHYADSDLDHALTRFWEIEALSDVRAMTKEESECEDFFLKTYQRDTAGRFTVTLPLKQPPPVLGSSRDIASRRLKSLEKRLSNDPVHQKEYIDFMKEYLSLGHMELVPQPEVLNPLNQTYFIPHHYVLKDSSTTTKFRVVFDASCKTSTGTSLNDALMVGPTVQDTLLDILLRFRLHKIAFTADIAKMYRQIAVSPNQTDLQRILWRDDPSHPIQEYRLLTVTYGTASAPYLATRVLNELAELEQDSLPLASSVARRDFYVDDLMSGENSVAAALEVQSQLIHLTSKGGLSLRKWSSNSSELLNSLPPEMRETQSLTSIEIDTTIKTLGVFWNPSDDEFLFRINLNQLQSNSQSPSFTKRVLLSEISKIFDPLGWLAPVIISAKILIQDLWKLNLDWDQDLPEEIKDKWVNFKGNLSILEQIKIKRCIMPGDWNKVDLLGYCDASEKAYAAVVYLCCYYSDRDPVISLITSKTRVAPAKQISLPRLELCGAVLLSNLMVTVQRAFKLTFNNVRAWTDSTVVLSWIQAHPSRWKTFVANRVTEIQNNIPQQHWSHIDGVLNPADCASRGIDPIDLVNHSLWWTGPPPQTLSAVNPLPLPNPSFVLQEERQVVIAATATLPEPTLLYKYSCLTKLLRLSSWWIRFFQYLKSKVLLKQGKCEQSPSKGPLTADEIAQAMTKWILITQQQSFPQELQALGSGKPLPNKSKIISLNPFLDSQGILRVGGRLRHAPIPTAQRTPILLPKHHKLTDLLITSTHLTYFHAGPQLMLSILHRRYWILGARDAVRLKYKKCVTCTRHGARVQQPFMGDLPSFRVTPARAFQKCGVDYAGPFILRAVPSRSKVTFKAYLCILVCFTTRAVHLEVVSSLETDAFLAAFKRFVSRRGKPSDMFSDCGTNFVGAARELKEMHSLVISSDHNRKIADQLSSEGVNWHFNPPGAPHFGGLWEAGVKSVKYHLYRIVGAERLTFEEMTTIMTQIEACLNSRPLTPMSSEPSDLNVLTPGHFLIGAPLVAIPEPDLTSLKTGRLSRWQNLQQMQQNFWKRWSQEFISRMQNRPKWMNHRTEIQVDDMVLIKDERLPPLKWKLGRVVILHPGADGVTRVVTLRTVDGEVKRPLVKLCLLPIENSINNDSASNL